MRLEYVYENMYELPSENKHFFTPKAKLTDLERIGLESIAVELLAQYEELEFGEPATRGRRGDLRDYIRWNDDNVDILDGVYNTYELNGFLFGCIWVTENGIPMLTAYRIPEDCEDWENHDFMDEFEEVYFRLD